ncbi:hypothetical protein C6P40_003304 [Pichia californica]|uniref:Peptide transporter PTR2 n=1 Tax=Pichia californica TaxID=460514 RepID=A0A9P6WQH8_9ASCO|nr:hypothetical protein C6P42_000920 [[Candida] californica]KAG0690283.1 hypothetical protein C6P40_003304 [[Candida] californica]
MTEFSKNNIELSIIPINDDIIDENCLHNEENDYIIENRKITGSIPKISYLICLVEFSERFSYYMISGCLTNMIQRSLPKDSINGSIIHNISSSTETPGALGLGLPLASFTMQFITFFSNFSPVISGYYADTKLGKYKSIYLGTIIGIIGHFILVISSLPSIINHSILSFIIVLISVAIIAIAAGFIKPNILPLLLDQYEYKLNKPNFKYLSNGSKVKIDHKATLEKLSMSFYMFINWGCTLSLLGSFMERYMGFWAVYLLTALVFAFLPLLLNYLNPRIIHSENLLDVENEDDNKSKNNINVYKEFYYYLKNYYWNTPLPLNLKLKIKETDINKFFDCIILFLFFIPFYLNDSALISIQISQAATMKSSVNLPNDFYQALNPVTIIIVIPLLSNLIYPYLLKHNKLPSSQTKIIIGFTICSIGSLLGAYAQNQIYLNSSCDINNVSNCNEPSNISLISWIFYFLMFILQATGECFASTTCYELAYELSPNFLRGGVLALFLTSVAMSSLIGEILSGWCKDPYLTKVYLYTGILGLLSTIGFYIWSKNKIHL